MFELIVTLMVPCRAEISFSDATKTLNIKDEATIDKAKFEEKHKTAVSCIITQTNGAVSIESGLFTDFSELKNLSISAPNNNVEIKNGAFSSAVHLTYLYINCKLVAIHYNTINSNNETDIKLEIDSFDTSTISVLSKEVHELKIKAKNDITFGLSSCSKSKVKKIKLEGSNVNFVQDSFAEASGIKDLKIEASSQITFGLNSFKGAEVEEIKVSAPNVIFVEGSFMNAITHKLDVEGKDLTLGLNSFKGSDVAKVKITGTGSVSIVESAFQNCGKLQNVNIDAKGDVTIGMNSFANNGALSEVYVKSESEATVVENAFKDCKSLRKAKIDAKESSIHEGAFTGCDNLGNDGLPGGATAGIVIAVLVIVAIAGFCVWKFVIAPKKGNKISNEEETEKP